MTLVAVATPEENIAIAEIIKSEDPQFESVNFIPLQDPNQGKRGALAVGLEKLNQLDLPPDTVSPQVTSSAHLDRLSMGNLWDQNLDSDESSATKADEPTRGQRSLR